MSSTDLEQRIRRANWAESEPSGFGSIPEALIGLIRARPDQYQNWCSRLEQCVLPQAALDQGTPIAIPFILELIDSHVAPVCLYSILSYILAATEAGDCGELGTACRQTIRSGLKTYLRDLQDSAQPDAARCASLDVICRLTEDRTAWEPLVRRAYETTSVPALRKEIVDWIGGD